MRISFSPILIEGALTLSKSGDVLTINGEAFDFSSLPDGATIPAGEVPCDHIRGPVERVDGFLRLTMLLPYGYDAPEARRFPQPIVNPDDGSIEMPGD